jgi:hypothetical protein
MNGVGVNLCPSISKAVDEQAHPCKKDKCHSKAIEKLGLGEEAQCQANDAKRNPNRQVHRHCSLWPFAFSQPAALLLVQLDMPLARMQLAKLF